MYDTENRPPTQEGRPKRPSAIFKNVGLGVGGLGVGYAGLKIGQSAPALAKSWQRTAVQARRAASEVTKRVPEIAKAATEAASQISKTAPEIAKTTSEVAGQIGKTAEAWRPRNLMPKGGALMNVMKKFWRGALPSQVRKLQSGQALLEFATLDYLRKYLVDEPMLARKGEPGWDPGVEAEVGAAALHKPRRSLMAEKMMVAEEKKRWRPRKGYKTTPVGGESIGGIVADPEGTVPGTSAKSIKTSVFKQLKDITLPPEKPEPLPPEMLKGPGGKPAFDPDVVMKGGHPNVPDLWDVEQAKKSVAGKVKFTPNLTPRKRPRAPRDEIERAALRRKVSAGAEAWRDPYAFHQARVKAGLTQNILVKHEAKVPGEPSVRFPNLVKEGAERSRAQGIRDVLAGKGWAYRKNVLNPLRAHIREQAGLPAIAPMGKEFWKRIGVRLSALRRGIIELEIKPTINIGGKAQVKRVKGKLVVGDVVGGIDFHPGTIRSFGKQFEADVGKRVAYHKREAVKIRKNLQSKIGQFTSPLEKGRLIREDAEEILAKSFDPGRTGQIDLIHAHKLATYTGHTPEEIFALHKAHLRHSHLGESQQGEDLLRKQILPKTLGKIPITPGEAPAVAKAASPLLKRTGIGLGIAGGAVAGAYLIHKLRKQRQQQQLEARCRLISFQEVQDAYREPTPWHQKEVRRWLLYPESRSRALQKGLERVGRIHRDIRAPKTDKGLIVDEKGRERQPEWRKPWFKRTVIGAGIVGAALTGRHIYGKLRRAGETAAGLSMEHIPLSAMSPGEHAAANITSGHTWRAIKARFPKTTGFFTSASSKVGGLTERYRQTKKSLIARGAGAVSKFTETQIGELGKGELIREGGVIKKVKWDDPAAIKENIERAQKIQQRGEQLKASGIAKEERARKAGTTRGTMEEALEKLRKQRESETKTSSLLKLIRFQQGDDVYVAPYSRRQVPVKEHWRSARSTQPQRKSKSYQQGFLTAAGIAGTGIGTAGGGYYVYNRVRQSAQRASQEVEANIAKRKAEIAVAESVKLRRAARAAKKAATKIIPHKFQSRLREIRFQIDPDKKPTDPTAWHDAAIGGLEGIGSFYTTEKLLQKTGLKGLPKLAVTGLLGGLGTAVAGYGLNRLIRKKVAARRAAKQELSSRLRLIRFQDPYYDELMLPRTKNQRTMVARDRYMKQIHERDIARADRLYKHTALIGAGIGALAARKPSKLLKSAGIGAAIGIGTQKAFRLYGQANRDPFGERTVHAKRVEEAPEVLGSAVLAGYGLKKLSKHLSARNRLIRFEEQPQRKHRLLTGAAVAAAGIPLYRGAGKLARIGLRARIDKFAGKPLNYGRQVADYIEASQHILNQGITGKAAGAFLRNPEHPVVKKAIKWMPAEFANLKTGGLNKISREHFSSFRASPTEALQAWTEEYHGVLQKRLLKSTSVDQFKARQGDIVKHQTQSENAMGHMGKLVNQGFNEREAIRHLANHPKHQELFKNLALLKSEPTKMYTAQSAGLAAVPATAGLAVAATTKKDRSRASVR